MSIVTRRRKSLDSRRRLISLEALEERRLLAVLTTGTGDGSLTVEVDGFGSFGSSVLGTLESGAIFDPVGPDSANLTAYESALAVRINSSGGNFWRDYLSSGFVVGAPDFPFIDPGTTGDATTAFSSFAYGPLSFNLTQTVAPVLGPNGQIGSVLKQEYVVTNTSGGNVDFELVRFNHSHLFFDSSSFSSGGRYVVEGRDVLFKTDFAGGPLTESNYVAIDAEGGVKPAAGRFEIDSFSDLGYTIGYGDPLDDKVLGDNDGDGFIDFGYEYDSNQGLRNLFSLAPGATTTYTTRTVFATGAPANFPIERNVSAGPDVSAFEVNAGLSDLVFSVSLDRPTQSQVAVNYALEGITATAGADFVAQSGVVTFVPGGPTTLTITAQIIGDTVAEGNETFRLRLTGATNGFITDAEAIGTILNDDVELAIGDMSIIEGNSGTKDAVFTVSAIGAVNRQVSFGYTTSNGSASAGSDYLARGGTGVIHPGATSATIVVPIVGDIFNELDETFFVTLTSAQNAVLIDALATGTIINNDALPNLYVNDPVVTTTAAGNYEAVFTVALDAPSGREVQVAYSTLNGGAIDGIDYLGKNGTLTFNPGITTLQVSVPVSTTGAYFPNKKFYLNLSGSTNSQIVDGQGAATIVYDDDTDGEYIIDDGGAGYTKSAGWTNLTNTLAYQLDYDYAPAGNGSATASWNFVGIPNGTYQVFTRWSHFGNRATNAPFTMLDNGVPVGTVLVNQQLAPAGEYSDGVYWQSLGFFSTTTNNFAVRLTNAANGFVVADAIRIVAGGIAPQTPEMDVAANEISIIAGDASPDPADGTHFGSVPIFADSAIQKFTITNNGNADLHLSDIPRVTISGAHAGDFHIVTQPASLVAPGKKTTFEVQFHPLAAGLRTATISIANSDDSEHPYTFTIQGNGLVQAVPLAHNSAFPQDVNDDGRVNTSDALSVINALLVKNAEPAAAPLAAVPLTASGEPVAAPLAAASTSYIDVNADGRLTTSDLLMVFNYLLLNAAPNAAPKAAEPLAAAVDQAIVLFDDQAQEAEDAVQLARPADVVAGHSAGDKPLAVVPALLLSSEELGSLVDDEAEELDA